MKSTALLCIGVLDNPIVRREWAQWRRGRAQWVAPALVAAALTMLLVAMPAGGPQPGRNALSFLGLTGILLALLLPPALAAPSIASEREASLLEGLHLTHLSPGEIVLGKWAGAFSRSLCLLLAALPVHLATLLMGGVSAREVLLVWACEVVAAAFACAGGIFCSAWGRTALSATRSAYGFALLHAIAAANALSVAASGRMALIPIPFHLPGPLQSVVAWFGATHPVAAMGLSWWQPWRTEIQGSGLSPMLSEPILLVSLCVQVLAAAALLALARGGVQRPFEAMPFLQKSAGEEESEARDWWALPVDKLSRSVNPVHAREFVTKFRMRAVPRAVLLFEAVLGLGVAIFYARAFWLGLFDASTRPLIWWALMLVAAIVGMTSLLVLGASGLARERELGTWDSLRLSFLSPGHILRGKMSAMLAASALFSVPFWPLLALCVRGWRSGERGIGVVEAACSLAILLAMAWSHGAFGLWLSARLKSSAATLCAMSAMLAWDLLLPLAISATPARPQQNALISFNATFNPVLALLQIADGQGHNPLAVATTSVLALTASGAFLLWNLHTTLQREWGARSDEVRSVDGNRAHSTPQRV